MHLPTLWAWMQARLHMGERDERGANMTEYVLVLTFIAVAVIAVVITLGGTIKGLFTDADTKLNQTP